MKILILGGGWQQLPAILRAKRMGLQVFVVDYPESRAASGHADGCRHICQKEILRLGEYMNPPFSARKQFGWDPAAYSRKLAENAVILTASDETGHIIGLIAAYLNRKEEAFISMLVVEQEYRRCRVAEALCLRIHEIARERGISRIRGEIRKDNTACRRLTQALGYQIRKDSLNADFVIVEREIGDSILNQK